MNNQLHTSASPSPFSLPRPQRHGRRLPHPFPSVLLVFSCFDSRFLVFPHRQVKQERQLRLTKTGTTTLGKGMTLIPNNLPNTKAGAGLRLPRDKNTATHGRKMGSAKKGHYANMPPRTPHLMALRLSILMTLTLRALQTKWRKKIGHGQNTRTKTRGRN